MGEDGHYLVVLSTLTDELGHDGCNPWIHRHRRMSSLGWLWRIVGIGGGNEIMSGPCWKPSLRLLMWEVEGSCGGNETMGLEGV